MINVRKCVHELSQYRPPWSNLDRKNYLRFDLNENTQPPPPHVKNALISYLKRDTLQIYPNYNDFMPILSGYVGVPTENLMVTNGSDQAIEVVLRAFLSPGDSMLVAQPEFPIFSSVAGVIGARVKGVPFTNKLSFPKDQFMESITLEVRLIVFINPNNPTGTQVDSHLIREVLQSHPEIPVLVDEAYFEYTQTTMMKHIEDYPNLIIIRTFSKAFAMAGLRLGYVAAATELIAEFAKIRGPFDVNSCAIAAAKAHLLDPSGWKRYAKEVMTESMPTLVKAMKDNGIKFTKSPAHFMLVWPNDRDYLIEYMKQRGILVRPMYAKLIEDSFRLSVGTMAETKIFIEAFKTYLKETT